MASVSSTLEDEVKKQACGIDSLQRFGASILGSEDVAKRGMPRRDRFGGSRFRRSCPEGSGRFGKNGRVPNKSSEMRQSVVASCSFEIRVG